MTEEQGYVMELALDKDFGYVDDDATIFSCTQQQLLIFTQAIADWARKCPDALVRVGRPMAESDGDA